MLKVLDEVCTPTMGSKYSAAIDLYAREDAVIGVGETKIIPLGVCIDLDGWLKSFEEFKGCHYLQLEPRSSLRAKGLQAGTGIIDMDFAQEIQLVLSNPIQYIDKQIDFDKDDDYIEIDYMGSPREREDDVIVKYSSYFKVNKGDKIAQIMLKEHKTYLMGISTEDKRVGGFGSTGSK